MDASQVEYIVLVDEAGTPIGQAEKLSTHHAETPLHLAFSCYVFNPQGQFLVTQRAHQKKVWPGVWTNSVCGHPAPGEGMEAAIKRRMQYEIGLIPSELTCAVRDYTYKTPAFKGVVEHEFCPIYVARTLGTPQSNPDEVADFKWITWKEYVAMASSDTNDTWSWWCKDQLRVLANHPLIKQFSDASESLVNER